MGSEKEYLKNYNIDDYERPSVTTDIAAFTIRSQSENSYRHDPENKLCVLLVKRGEHPFKGCWALPGGFLKKGETVEECALREITEETNVTPAAILPAGVYSETGRDPRGWIISNAFVSVISGDVNEIGGDDASEARWFEISLESDDNSASLLKLKSGDILLEAALKERERRFSRPQLEIVDGGKIAFDHARIIADCLTLLRKEAENVETLFDFLPETFTLAELRKTQETILDVSLLNANFRRKIADYVKETDKQVTGAGHRPAKLYTKK